MKFFVDKNYKIFFLFTLELFEICNCWNLQSPCPKIYQYNRDQKYGIFGEIFVKSPSETEIKLDVQISVPNHISQDDTGEIELGYSKEKTLENILSGKPIYYKIYFPRWKNHPPKVTEISLNDIRICIGRGFQLNEVQILTTVNLQHLLTTNIQTQTRNKFPIPNDYDFNPTLPKSNNEFVQIYNIDFNPQPPEQTNIPIRYLNGERINISSTPNLLPSNSMIRSNGQIYKNNPFLNKPPNFDSAAQNYPVKTDLVYFTPPLLPQVKNKKQNLREICGISYRGNYLIANGGDVAKYTYPWVVAIYTIWKKKANFSCAGTLISNKHVITAAHCVKRNSESIFEPEELLVALGRHNIYDFNEGISLKPKSINPHKDYRKMHADADIAVIILPYELKFSETIKPICIWDEPSDLSYVVGEKGIVVGWGTDEKGTFIVPEPKEIALPIVSQEDCMNSNIFFHDKVSDRTFCAGNRDGKGPCNGDSGGGFMMLRNGRWTLRGIVSMSVLDPLNSKIKCDFSEFFIFSDVPKFLIWLSLFFE